MARMLALSSTAIRRRTRLFRSMTQGTPRASLRVLLRASLWVSLERAWNSPSSEPGLPQRACDSPSSEPWVSLERAWFAFKRACGLPRAPEFAFKRPVDSPSSEPVNSPSSEPVFAFKRARELAFKQGELAFKRPINSPSSAPVGLPRAAGGCSLEQPVDTPSSEPVDSPSSEPGNSPSSEPVVAFKRAWGFSSSALIAFKRACEFSLERARGRNAWRRRCLDQCGLSQCVFRRLAADDDVRHAWVGGERMGRV